MTLRWPETIRTAIKRQMMQTNRSRSMRRRQNPTRASSQNGRERMTTRSERHVAGVAECGDVGGGRSFGEASIAARRFDDRAECRCAAASGAEPTDPLYDGRRRGGASPAQHQRSWLVMAGQLAATAAVLAAIGGDCLAFVAAAFGGQTLRFGDVTGRLG